MSVTQSSARDDQSRPLIVVAEREQPVEDGIRLMDLAVMAYRLRWKVIGVWVVCAAAVIVSTLRGPAFEWRMEIDVQGTTLDRIAMMAAERPGLDRKSTRLNSSHRT